MESPEAIPATNARSAREGPGGGASRAALTPDSGRSDGQGWAESRCWYCRPVELSFCMARKASQEIEPTLAIDDDGDDVDVLRAIEQSFGLKFDGPVSWVTVGDAYAALLRAVPAADSAGKCATTMAFYRLRRALRTVLKSNGSVRPRTRLRDLTRRPAKRVLRELSREIDLPISGFALSWIGGVGLLLVLAGIGGGLVSLSLLQARPLVVLFPLGLALVRLDPGTFGTQTVGDMARSLAIQNYSAFAQAGADRRPGAIWSALVGLLGDFAGLDPAKIDRGTRLLA